MNSQLEALLTVAPDEVTGLLEEYVPASIQFDPKRPISFFYLKFQDDLPRTGHFISKLCDRIISFCLKRERVLDVTHANARRSFIEARRKFAQPSNGKTGEPGELILYFLLEGHLRLPKILSKMSLKTNGNMNVNGSDGVHLGIDDSDIFLYFGEAKLYKPLSDGISEALESVKEFISPTNNTQSYNQSDFEISVIMDHLDLPDGPLRERMMAALDPYSTERSNLRYVHACFIGFDLDELCTRCTQQDFLKIYEQRVVTSSRLIEKKISADPLLCNQRWHFFFIPFGSVDDFRKSFLAELNT